MGVIHTKGCETDATTFTRIENRVKSSVTANSISGCSIYNWLVPQNVGLIVVDYQ